MQDFFWKQRAAMKTQADRSDQYQGRDSKLAISNVAPLRTFAGLSGASLFFNIVFTRKD